MGVAVKGGMYCDSCKRPVAAQKQTHGVRNFAAAAFYIPTLGGSTVAGKIEGWHCPHCGGKVRIDSPPKGPSLTNRMEAFTDRAVAEGRLELRCKQNGHLVKKDATRSGESEGVIYFKYAEPNKCPIDGSKVRLVNARRWAKKQERLAKKQF